MDVTSVIFSEFSIAHCVYMCACLHKKLANMCYCNFEGRLKMQLTDVGEFDS